MPAVLRTTSLTLLAILLCGCGEGDLNGTYGDAAGETRYEFRRGQVHITVLGTTVAGEYTLQGDKVLVTSPQGTVVLRRRGPSLYGPMGLELTRMDPATHRPDQAPPDHSNDDHRTDEHRTYREKPDETPRHE